MENRPLPAPFLREPAPAADVVAGGRRNAAPAWLEQPRPRHV